MADASRRARAGDGDGQELPADTLPRRAGLEVTVERTPQPPVRAAADPDPETAPVVPPVVVAAPPQLQSPPEPVLPRPPVSRRARPVGPALVFDDVAEERTGAAPGPAAALRACAAPSTDAATAAPPLMEHRHTAQRDHDPARGLRRAVVGVSAALVVVVAALIGSMLAGGGAPPVSSGGGLPTPTTTPPTSAVPASTSTAPTAGPAAGPATSRPATTTPSAASPTRTAAPGGPPVLAALQPSSGPAGQAVTISGSGFLSPSGQISATVGGQTASVSCPDQTTCTVTIPPPIGTATTEPVVIVTDGGSSNPLTFTLG